MRRAALLVALAAAGATGLGGESAGGEIRIGILSACEGAPAAHYRESTAGARLPLIERGGTLDGPRAADGVSLVSIGGKRVRLAFRCSDGTPRTALAAARRLVERDRAVILIGPLATAEGAAVRRYAQRQPRIAFVNGASGARGAGPRNFFSFGTDGAQWTAGLGAYAYRSLGWRTATIVGDDAAQNAGFSAEFCSLGGKVVTAPSRRRADGFFLSLDDEEAVAFVEAYRGQDLARRVIGGPLAFDERTLKVLGDRLLGVVAAQPFPPDSRLPAWTRYEAAFEAAFPGVRARSLFSVLYYDAMRAVLEALDAVGGDLSGGERTFMAALARVRLNAPNGPVRLDRSRRAIGSNYVVKVVEDRNGKPAFQTLRRIAGVDPTLPAARKACDQST